MTKDSIMVLSVLLSTYHLKLKSFTSTHFKTDKN